jgi:hypothetical protein
MNGRVIEALCDVTPVAQALGGVPDRQSLAAEAILTCGQ